MAESEKAESKNKKVLRREFLTGSGAAIAAGALAITATDSAAAAFAQPAASDAKPVAASTGYLVYDSRLCLGCQSCMFACSLTHEGEANPSLSRIQIIRDSPSFTKYPFDVVMSLCRQCVSPLCVQNCPTGACYVDAANGNIRRIDQSKCIGCQRCIQSCPQRPHRTVWDPVKRKSTKCDLCADAPFWSQKGGPTGKQACIESCPVKAIKLVATPPNQTDIAGYDINLAPPPPKMGGFGMGAPGAAPKAPAAAPKAPQTAPKTGGN
ncbi:MAG: 4Fe-4S dicluster domain-containing protein [Acidobacteriota bacterium]|nr:4Fe-4S dicluster domain-containing protein [Acidobacteriota bacterium]